MFFNVSIDDVLFWMDAIRNSEDRYRTLESFWKGQIKSKIWLIDNLKNHLSHPGEYTVAIYGGWNGVLASLLYNSGIGIRHISSIDIDPTCKEIANTMNKKYEMAGVFTAVTADMVEYTIEDAEIVINTSCEHITQEQYDQWLFNQPNNSLIILQSNNYSSLDEHIRCASSLGEFEKQSNLEVMFSGVFETPKYDRYMIIGNKRV